MAHILGCLPARVGLAAAAADLALPLRTVEAAFARAGVNPREHLRQARLLALHRDLIAGRFASTDAALLRWGFPPRSGNVASDYRRLFGCSPSRTLSRGRNEAGT